MAGKKGRGPGFILYWPWNVLLYLVLVWYLRLYAAPLILGLMWLQRRNNPHGAAEGYCLSRTRKRLVWVLWGLLALAIGLCCGAAAWVGLGQDRTYWDIWDYVTLVVGAVGGAAFTLLGLYSIGVALRDSIFPDRSALAKSIRRQLGEEAGGLDVGELFALVDADLAEGRWFEELGVGREWVLGDLAVRIGRLRGIFTEDRVHTHHTQTGIRHSRSLELVLLDDQWGRAVFAFHSPGKLREAADYLSELIPEAATGHNAYLDFWLYNDEERAAFEAEFQEKRARRPEA